MAEDPVRGGAMKASTVSVVLGPKGIVLDNSGRITFEEPEIEHVILHGGPEDQDPVTPQGINLYKCNDRCEAK